MRQLAVAQRANWFGLATLVVPSEGAPLLAQLEPPVQGLVVPPLAAEAEAEWLLERFGTQAIYFVDSYRLPPPFYERLFTAARVVAFEDGERQPTASMVVKPRPADDDPPPGVLEGCDYIPVRSAFMRQHRVSFGSGTRHLVICFGASDPTGGASTILSRLLDIPPHGWRISVVRGLLQTVADVYAVDALRARGWRVDELFAPDMPGLLASADAAVVAAGSILWELATLGIPTLAYTVVDNQDRNARWLAEEGCIAGGGRLGLDPPAERAALTQLLSDEAGREALGRALASTVDGLGAQRILDAALELSQPLRRAG